MRIVVLTHTTTRSGAPLLLIKLVQWLQRTTSAEVVIINRESGELDSAFSALAPALHFRLPFKIRSARQLQHLAPLWRRVVDALTGAYIKFRLWRFLSGDKETVILSNTVACNDLLHFVQGGVKNLRRTCVYVHELDNARASLRRSSDAWGIPFPLGDRLLCCSQAVLNSFSAVEGEHGDRLHLMPYYFLDPPLAENSGFAERRIGPFGLIPTLRPDHVLVGGIGSPSWRKGFDLFLSLAKRLESDPRFWFAWLGRQEGSSTDREYADEVAKLQLSNLTWLPYEPSSEAFLRRCDIFALTSREDPFPLVNLEAMAMRCPVVCFDGTAGGAAEIVSLGAGTVVPYGDLGEFAGAIGDYSDPSTRRRVGDRGVALARDYFEDDTSGRRLLELLGLTDHCSPLFTH